MTRNKRTTAYWLALLAVFGMACGLLSVGPIRAHYPNQVYFNAVVKAGNPVSSDCLVEGGQTVLLGELTESAVIPISFRSEGSAYGILSCQLADPEQEEFLSAYLSDEVIFLAGGTEYAVLCLDLMEEMTLPEEDLTVDIFVSFSNGEQELEATFRATIPGIAVETDSGEGETTDPESGEGETTEPESGEGETTDPESGEGETTDPESGEGETTAPESGEGETTDPENGEGETTEPEGGEEETTDPESGEGETTEPESGEGETTEPESGEGETTEPESSEGETTEPESGEGETTEPESGEGETTTPESGEGETTEPESGEGETTEPESGEGETTDPENGEEETTTPESGEGEATTPESGEGGTTEPESGEGETTEPESGEGETTSPEAEEPVIPVYEDLVLETLTVYTKSDYLPVAFVFPDGTYQLEVSQLDIESGQESDFPAYVRYSVDGGESWYMLYYGGTVQLEEVDLWILGTVGNCLLLDLSGTELDAAQDICVRAEAYTGEDFHIGSAEIYSMEMTSSYAVESGGTDIPVLSADGTLLLQERAVDGERSYILEHLVLLEDGTLEYEAVPEGFFSVQFGVDAAELSVDDYLPSAGTYRLRVIYEFNGICFARSNHTFFVNYLEST